MISFLESEACVVKGSSFLQAHIHAYVHTYIYTHIHTDDLISGVGGVRSERFVISPSTHTYARTYIHTYTHTCR
jgi:hypothetical protein